MPGFVQRDGSQLTIDGRILKFASFNTPNLHVLEDPWQRISLYEQVDTISSIAQIGGQVARIYTLSVPKYAADTSRHIIVLAGFATPNVTWIINEDLFMDLDSAIYVSSLYNIKLIIPIIDYWEWWGGVKAFAALYGGSELDFYQSDTIKNGFKNLVTTLLDRNNTSSGIRYKNDPTIMAWETGNELQYSGLQTPLDWTIEIASFIKSSDHNHLVIDGSYGKFGWDVKVLTSRDIDLYSNHYYPEPLSIALYSPSEITGMLIGLLCFLVAAISLILIPFYPTFFANKPSSNDRKWYSNKKRILKAGLIATLVIGFASFVTIASYRALNQDFARRLSSDIAAITAHNKSFLVGEIGVAPSSIIGSTMDCFAKMDVSGILVWSLRPHSKNGGFHVHEESGGYQSYHYPGFASGFGTDEVEMMNIVRNTNLRIGNTFSLIKPDPPLFLQSNKTGDQTLLRWRGSAGAQSYSIREFGLDSYIAVDITDNKKPGSVLYSLDTTLYKSKGMTSLNIILVAKGAWGSIDSINQTFVI